MKIPKEEFAKGVELCFNNVTRLLEDANLLLDKGSYGHAQFLVISAIEETSKAFMYSCGRIEIWKGSELFRDVINHHQKYFLFILMIFADSFSHAFNKAIQKKEKELPKTLKLEDIEELVKDLETTKKEIWKARLQSLYVDNQQGKWLSPNDINREEVEELLQYAKKYKRMMESLCPNILRAPLDRSKQILEYVDDQLFPSILEQLPKKAKWFFNNGLIDEKLYNKLSTARK